MVTTQISDSNVLLSNLQICFYCLSNNFVQSENILVLTITCLQRFSATCRTGTYDVLASHCRAELGYNVSTHLQLIEHHNWPGCEDKRDLQHGVRLQARQPSGPHNWLVQVQMKNPLPFFLLFQYVYMKLIFRKMKHKIELENKCKQHVWIEVNFAAPRTAQRAVPQFTLFY